MTVVHDVECDMGEDCSCVPRDEHGNEALGVCMNCGAAMVEDPMWPWCPECE